MTSILFLLGSLFGISLALLLLGLTRASVETEDQLPELGSSSALR